VIRRAGADDVEAMAAVWMRSAFTAYVDIFPAEAPKPTLDDLMSELDHATCLVAVDGTAIVGLVQARDAWLSHLYVDPPQWHRGVGAMLHDAAVEELRRQGHARASLWVLRENKVARAMYERRGWMLTDVTRPVYAAGGVDDVNYVLELRSP
jgi:GNAT superfamily N-acetyltransferase